MAKATSIAFFVSSHGLGHAARATAVMAAVRERHPSVRFDIFTSAPEWLFRETLHGAFEYHDMQTDVGMKQRTPFHEDISGTLTDLDRFFPFNPEAIEAVARMLKESGVRLILCDISPMGIAVGAEAGIPSVLIENFTWDWIYQTYAEIAPQFISHIEFLKTLFAGAGYHVQTEPVCCRQNADLTVSPISRKPRTKASQIRETLGLNGQGAVVHITMGGIPQEYAIKDRLKAYPDMHFIISGSGPALECDANVFTLPYHSSLYHPDIINAADLVIGKAGYSTLAEVYYAGIPYVYVERPLFRESDILSDFIGTHMHGMAITVEEFESGAWIGDIPRLLDKPVLCRGETTGAEQVAEFVSRLL